MPDVVDDRTLQLAREGDRKARDALLRALQDPLYRFCLRLLNGDEHDAVDATQEAAMRVLKSLSGFDGRSAVRTWAFGIALNVAREMRRSRKPTSEIVDEPAEDERPDEVERNEQAQRMRELLGELGERQREAIVLRFFEEMSVEQTADAMECSQGTVKATVFQALRVLREKMNRKR